MHGSYNYVFVVLSVLISIVGSFVGLQLAAQITATTENRQRYWLASGTFAMGVAIWSMHYTAMLAFSLPVPIQYHVPTAVLSWVIATAASSLALYLVTRSGFGRTELAVGSLLNGLGIVGLHYTAMASMRFEGIHLYTPLLIIFATFNAIAGSLLSLWLTFRHRSRHVGVTWVAIRSSLAMGAAISSMHYTGMASARFFPVAHAEDYTHTVSVTRLGTVAFVSVTMMVLAFTLISILIAQQLEKNAEVQRLAGQLLRSQDEERRIIGRELHDSTAQGLVALVTILSQLDDSPPSSMSKVRTIASQCREVAEQCLRAVRTLSYVMHPPMLEKIGLGDAIQDYVEGFTQRSGINVELEISPQLPRLARERELALYRVVQEALTNIQRHSGSMEAKIRIERLSGKLALEVIDKGRGILPRDHRSSTRTAGLGVGIPSMQERVKQVGGSFEIRSDTCGTTIRVIISIDDQ
jgi:signal transduction histidine kinase